MAISINRYVDITSGVGAGASVSTRDLGARLFTENELVPTGEYVTFTSAIDVGDYFGTSSEEYDRAVFYFGFISKNITKPNQITYARWASADTPSQIFGNPATYALGSFTGVTTGDFTLTLGGYTSHVTGINFSAAGSLAGVAAVMQTKIRAVSGGGTPWTSATVTYDATRGCFNLESGDTGADTISVTAGVTVDVASLLGWLTGAILSNGANAQTVTEVLSASYTDSNDFGSFTFMPTLTQDEIVEAAEWNDALNNVFIYSVRCTSSNAAALSAALEDLSGATLTLSPLSSEYPEMAPMMILAATDYTARGAVQNYMFYEFNLTASVTNNTDANTYDALRVNYYGQTQTAGQLIEFYQRGYMYGLSTDARDQNTYANEIWLKDAMTAQIMSGLLALTEIPANAKGRSIILALMQEIIDLGIFNGVISIGKTLNTEQKLFITTATGDPDAWRQVQNAGYWVDVVIQSYVNNDATEYKAVYTLIYAKDDVIRLVEGRDILI